MNGTEKILLSLTNTKKVRRNPIAPNHAQCASVRRYLLKFITGTPGERATLYRAARDTDGARRWYDIPDTIGEDMKFELVELDRVNIGEPFALVVRIENKSREPRNIQAVVSVKSVYYNGVSAGLVKKAVDDILLHPGDSKHLCNFYIERFFRGRLLSSKKQ